MAQYVPIRFDSDSRRGIVAGARFDSIPVSGFPIRTEPSPGAVVRQPIPFDSSHGDCDSNRFFSIPVALSRDPIRLGSNPITVDSSRFGSSHAWL